jgi:hypothetical protein
MRTALRAVAWAEWAGWTCKERQRSLLPDARRLAREDRRPPSGNRRGFFAGSATMRIGARSAGRQILAAHPSLSTHTSNGVETLPRMRHTGVVRCVVPCVPVATRRFTHLKENPDVFVESCCVHGAHGNGPAFSPAARLAPHRREKRASGAERSAHLFHEQEVRQSRSRIPVHPHSLIRHSSSSAIDRIRDDVRQR